MLDLYKRNLDDEKRVFGAMDGDDEPGAGLSKEEKRIAELKEMLYGLAVKFKQKKEVEKLYQKCAHFPVDMPGS